MNNKLTIQQIAEIAGVNKATVSRVLNGNTTISRKTREKVEQLIKEYNYVPNSMARGLAFNKTFTVGFCHDYTDKRAFANLFFYKVLQGIENVIYRNDYLFLMMSHHAREQGKSMFERVVSEHRVDGIILPSSLCNEANYELLEKHRMPFVILGEKEFELRSVRWVDVDNQQAATVLTERLIELGHRRIGIYADQEAVKRDKFIADRIKGYTRMMNKSGLPAFVATEMEDLYAHAPEAVICCTHDQLFGLLDDAKAEVSLNRAALATFDDNPLFQYLKTPVHYISIDLEKMGEQAALLLFSMIYQEADIPNFVQIPTIMTKTT
ncbi:MAG TPA: LacI family DNA-binding transcriptional regulator [Bacilli bacterium]